jgi:Uma2 family endonuclease
MSTKALKTVRSQTMAEVLDQLGGIPPSRVLMTPTPGTATEQDVIAIHDREHRLCELIDGVLVEKTMGFEESIYAGWVVYYLIAYLKGRKIGQAFTADGLVRLTDGQIRIPDAAFISRERLSRIKRGTILEIAPDLVVEVLSKGNTRREMDKKLREYFASGVRIVWYADPKKRTVRVYEAVDRSVLLNDDDELDGGDVLPGFRLSIREWFDEAAE